MPTVHLMCGFLGTGKTTTARRLAVQNNAVLLTHDDVMRRFYGRTPDDFETKYEIADRFIWDLAEKIVAAGASVVLDYGFLTKEARRTAYERASVFCPNVRFHCVECDLNVAKKRVLERTKTDDDSLMVDEHCFEKWLKKFEPLTPEEGYDVIYYRNV